MISQLNVDVMYDKLAILHSMIGREFCIPRQIRLIKLGYRDSIYGFDSPGPWLKGVNMWHYLIIRVN